MAICWYCDAEVKFEDGELTKNCPGCGVEVDVTNSYQPNKEDSNCYNNPNKTV